MMTKKGSGMLMKTYRTKGEDLKQAQETLKIAFVNLLQFLQSCKKENGNYDIVDGLGDVISTGIQPQSLVLYGLLYTYKNQYNSIAEVASEKDKIREITLIVFEQIIELIDKDGFNGRPSIVCKKASPFTKGEKQFIPDVAWFLSLLLIIRRIHIDGLLDFSEIDENVQNNIKKCCKIIIKSQNPYGCEKSGWGFASDAGANSLYFSYSVSAAISDFYSLVYDLDRKKQERKEDTVLIDVLSQEKNKDALTLLDEMELAKNGLIKWYLKFIFPLIPHLAKCTDPKVYIYDNKRKQEYGSLEDNSINHIIEQVGLKKDDILRLDDSLKNKLGLEKNEDYYYFYYALYAMDMYSSSGAAEYLEKVLITATDEMKEFKDELINHYGKYRVFTAVDLAFMKDDRTFVRRFMEEAMNSLHSSFNKIVRTDKGFWDSTKAAIKISLRYRDIDENTDFIEELDKFSQNPLISDPTILPLFLKINIQHCLTIKGESDKIVDEIMEEIINDRIISEDLEHENAKNNYHIFPEMVGLWDRSHFSLFVTEKSIESLVEYINYSQKYSETTGGDKTTTKVVEIENPIIVELKNLVNELLEKKESEINSKIALLDQKINDINKPSSDKKNATVSLSGSLQKINQNMSNFGYLDKTKTQAADEYAFISLFENLLISWYYNVIMLEHPELKGDTSANSKQKESIKQEAKTFLITLKEAAKQNHMITKEDSQAVKVLIEQLYAQWELSRKKNATPKRDEAKRGVNQ